MELAKRSAVQSKILQILSQVLEQHLDSPVLDKSFLALGGDSSAAVQIASRARKHGLTITLQDLLQYESLKDLCETVSSRGVMRWQNEDLSEGPDKGLLFPMSPLQKLQSRITIPVAKLFVLEQQTSERAVRESVRQLVRCNDALRARIVVSDHGDIQGRIEPYSKNLVAFNVHEFSTLENAMSDLETLQLTTKLGMVDGPTCVAVNFMTGQKPSCFGLMLHGCFVDAVSWDVIAQTMETKLSRGREKTQISLSTDEHAEEIANGDDFGSNPESSSDTSSTSIIVRLPPDLSGTLHESSAPPMSQGNGSHVILGALALAAHYSGKTSSETVQLMELINGRVNMEQAQIIGNFDKICHFHFDRQVTESDVSLIRAIEDQRWSYLASSQPVAGENAREDAMNKFLHTPNCLIVDFTSFLPTKSTHMLPIGRTKGELLSSSISGHSPILVSCTQEGIKFSTQSSISDEDTHLQILAETFHQCLMALSQRLRDQPQVATLRSFPYLPLTYSSVDNVVRKLRTLGIDPLADVEAVMPCSQMQDAILLAQAINPILYQCSFGFTLSSPIDALDLSRFQSAWDRVVERHPYLRSIFVESEVRRGSFDQLVLKRISSTSRTLRYPMSATEGLDSPGALISGLHEIPHRMHFLPFSDTEIYCRFDCSHAVVDGTSVEILAKELCATYHNQESPEIALSYRELTDFQSRARLDTYWSDFVSGTHMVQLPVSNPHVEAKDFRIINLDMDINLSALQSFCSSQETTLAQACQLAWALVLQRFTGSSDVCFSHITTGRDVEVQGLAEAVGPFVNTLPCRVNFNNDSTAVDALKQLKRDFLESLPHQNMPMGQRNAQPSSDRYGNTVMSFMRRNEEITGSSALNFKFLYRYTPTNFDLAIHIHNVGKSFHVEIEFWASRVEESLARRIGHAFAVAMSAILHQPHTRLRHLSLLSDSDLSQIRQWNTKTHKPCVETLDELVRAKTMQQPDALAVVSWDGKLTYSELHHKAERLASLLKYLGVKPGVKVGLSFEKSLWAVVSQLAVLKAGGAVVSLGITNPVDQLRGIVEDIAARLILVSANQAARLGGISSHAVTVDAELLSSIPKDEVTKPSAKSCDPAWIIFTSGSTGKPKGVVLDHSTLSSTIQSHVPVYGIKQHTRVLQFSSYTFDISIYDTLTTLSAGGCVCIPSEEDRLSNLVDAMNDLRVDWAALTSTVASLLHPSQLPMLKTLVLLGEPASPAVIEQWAPHSTVLNAYGPAEGCVTTVGPLESKEDAPRVGYPLGCNLWVVDTHDHNVLNPVGVPGELLIEGPLLARGYLNDGAKTERSFITDPEFVHQYKFSVGRRMYCTGDLVRQDSDGAIRHLGRIDSQMKINGQRVDPGEIEHWAKALGKDVQRATVNLINPSKQKEKHILALAVDFALGSAFSAPNSGILEMSSTLHEAMDALRSSLHEKVPPYMVPSLYVPMGEIPQNASSKIDRRAVCNMLEALDEEQLVIYSLAGTWKRAASTETERILQGLWADALRTSTRAIGADEDFFRAGGDSLAAMQLVALCRKEQIHLIVADVFQNPRLGQMANLIEKRQSEQSVIGETEDVPFSLFSATDESIAEIAALCEVDTDAIEDIYPCTPLQEGLLALSTHQSHAYVLRQVFRLDVSIDTQKFQEAWHTLVQSTPILRTVIVPDPQSSLEDSRSLQVVLHTSTLCTSGTSLDLYLDRDRRSSMGYGRPLSRCAIIETLPGSAQNERYFVWTAHHSVYDAPTLGKIHYLLEEAYAGRPLPSIVSLRRFVKHLQHPDRKSEETQVYWQYQLDRDLATFPDIPDSKYTPKASQQLIHMMDTGIQNNTTVTVSTLLRAAWALIISKYTTADHTIFAATVSGRTAPVQGIDDILGPTLATVPVHICIGTKTVHEFLETVQHQSSAMMSYEYTGLQNIEKMVPRFHAQEHLRHLFVTQLVQEDDAGTKCFHGLEPLFIDNQGFDGYALNVVSTVTDKGTVSVEVRFDELVITQLQVQRLLNQFEYVFKQFNESNCSLLVEEVDIMSPTDLAQMRQLNGRKPAPPLSSCIHDLVFERVESQPNATAVCAWDGELTYAELDIMAEKLASYLTTVGVGSEVHVGVHFEKSKFAVVAMYAILKAGGVVVPVGINHPISRIRSTMNETRSPLILAGNTRSSERLRELDICTLKIDTELFANLEDSKELNWTATVGPSNAAFVIYTSGSTGLPKGVVLEHQALCTSMRAHGNSFEMCSSSRVVQFAAYTFDAAIQEIFTTLCFGGCICVISEEDRMSNLAGAMRELQVNYAGLTSTVASLLSPVQLPLLRMLVLFGEPVKPAVVSAWSRHAKVINAYGPSECCIHSSAGVPMINRSEASNIGFPLAGGRFWVVDLADDSKLCPIGIPGELFIESSLLARGYLDNPEKSNLAFFIPSWVEKYNLDCERMYRTGDLVKQNVDGSFTHLGRADSQIKINGQRIEPGEVEYWAKIFCPAIQNVSVNLRHDPAKKPVLALTLDLAEWSAYYDTPIKTSNGLLPVSSRLHDLLDQLRTALFDVVPAYMVPTLYVPMEQLPQTLTTKVDRRAIATLLQNLDERQLFQYTLSNVPKQSPSTTMEKRLASHWAKALDLTKHITAVGVNDNFFREGGDSVTAMHLATSFRKSGIPLTVADIFRNPKFADLAVAAEGNEVKLDMDNEADTPDKPFSLFTAATIGPSESTRPLLEQIASQCEVPADRIEDIYPCTPLQEGLFAITMQKPQAYIFRQVFRISSIDIDRFKEAWQTAAQLVQILRSVIVHGPNLRLLQAVLRGRLEWYKSSSLVSYLESDQNLSIRPGRPLSRYAVVEEGTKNYFVWTAHHSAYDGYTLRRIFQLVAQIYMQKPCQQIAPFKNFVNYLQQMDGEKTKKFWQTQLQDSSASFPELPDPAYQAQPTSRLVRRVHAPRLALPVTTASVLRSSWGLVVAQHTNATNVLFGVTLSGRTAAVANIDEVAGPTITTVPVRIQLDRKQRVGDFLMAVQQQATDMMPFEHTGLQYIRRLVSKDFPQIQHLFLVQTPQEKEENAASLISGLEPCLMDSHGFDSYALNVICTSDQDESGTFEIEIRFDENVITPYEVESLVRQFSHVLNQLNHNIDSTVEELDLMTPHDIARILHWNRSEPVARQHTLHELVHLRTLRQPDALAVQSWDGNISYQELDTMSSRLTNRLLSLGVSSEVMVGLCFDKSKWAIIATLAVLKAGGVVVHIGVQQPINRIRTILTDISTSLVLVDPGHEKKFKGLVPTTLIVDSQLFVKEADVDNKDLSVREMAAPSNPAIIIFTSGSTGTPKGVVLTHEALCTSILTHGAFFGINTSTKALQFSAYTFDVSIQETFTTLAYGGCVCIISEDDRMNRLTESINAIQANFVSLTSTVASMLHPSEVPSIKTMILLGEAVKPSVVEEWADHAQVISAYGPSECSIHATAAPPMTGKAQAANIGYGLSCNTWVTEAANPNRLCPIGSVGELLIEGPIQAQGYLNDSEKTANAFITDPDWVVKHGLTPGRRFYRTGDLVRQNSDGSLSYLGRADTQVKIRGQRVEIGEIEHHLSEQEHILDAVVLYPRRGPCESKLIGLLVLKEHATHGNNDDDVEALERYEYDEHILTIIRSVRNHISQHVMRYMVPSAWIILKTIPHTATGKTDRLRLHSWLEQLTNSQQYLVTVEDPGSCVREPASHTERKLLSICASLLEVEPMSLGRSFINLGGDSVLAMQLVSQCRQSGFSINVATVLQSASLAEIAAAMDAPDTIEMNCEAVDWKAEAALDAVMEPTAPTVSADGGIEIILTGSTGFLGQHILEELIVSPSVDRIHCIAVRKHGQGSARTKFASSPKILTYTGDLSQSRLGLSREQYERLASCSAIIHCGAQVSFVQPYSAVRAANVLSTKELVNLAIGNRIPFHFISTLGVARLSQNHVFGEDSVFPYKPTYITDGYIASKWVSEVCLENANRIFGVPVTIHRPSTIIGPHAPKTDIANSLLHFSQQMGLVPPFASWEGHLDTVGIAEVTRNITRSVLQSVSTAATARSLVDRHNETLKYCHESGQTVMPFREIKTYLEQSHGLEMTEVSMREWVERATTLGLNRAVADFLVEADASRNAAAPMPLCETSRTYSGRVTD